MHSNRPLFTDFDAPPVRIAPSINHPLASKVATAVVVVGSVAIGRITGCGIAIAVFIGPGGSSSQCAES